MRIDEPAVMTGMARYDGPSRDGHGLKVTRHDGPCVLSPVVTDHHDASTSGNLRAGER